MGWLDACQRSGATDCEEKRMVDMTPHYDWTPASEPPTHGRQVVGWHHNGYFIGVHYLNGNWFYEADARHTHAVKYWRDVEPPDVEAPK